MTMKLGQLVPLGLILLCPLCPQAYADETNHYMLAKAFTAKCLADTNIFIFNPPADQNPYKDMSKEEVQGVQQRAVRNGAVLFLYLDGVPSKIESRRDYKEHGLCQTWYPDGRTRTLEQYESGKLLAGSYFDSAGALLGKIENGTGRKIIFSEPLDQRGEPVRGSVDYVQGMKDGLEVYYSNYERKQKSYEAHYKGGKLQGPTIQWTPTGDKNLEEFYKDGVKHGRSTCWHRNGRVQSTSEYIDGKQSGPWIQYYETGIKAVEVTSNEFARWYPSGQLMVRKQQGGGGSVINGNSFDSLGNLNGSVTNQVGSLIEGEDVDRHGCYRLFLFERERPFQSILLPQPMDSYNYGTNDLHLTMAMEALDKDIDNLKMCLLIPAGCHSQDKLTYSLSHLNAGTSTNFGPALIMMPEPMDKWTGSIQVDVQAVVAGTTVRYQHTLINNVPRTREALNRQQKKTKPVPRRGTPYFFGNKRPAPTVEGKTLPPYDQATDYWRLGNVAWVLYKSPAILLMSGDSGQTWRSVKNDFCYRPGGLNVRAGDDIVVWGTKPTLDVNRGIAYVVEQSRDGCKSWSPFKIPKVDFLLGIGGNEELLVISAIRIPKSGIPPTKDWFEMPHTSFMSKNGTNFSEVVGPSFFDMESIKAKSVAPNGKFRAFLGVTSWLDTSYALYLATAMDEVPIHRLYPSAAGEMIWSANSRILAMKNREHYIAYVDTSTGESGHVSFPFSNGASQRQKDEIAALDTKIKNLLDANKELAVKPSRTTETDRQ